MCFLVLVTAANKGAATCSPTVAPLGSDSLARTRWLLSGCLPHGAGAEESILGYSTFSCVFQFSCNGHFLLEYILLYVFDVFSQRIPDFG